MPTIIILLHGCPLRFLGPYGNEWVATPNLDRLAATGTVWDWHYANQPGNYPSWIPPNAIWLRNIRPGITDTPTAARRIDCPPINSTHSPFEPVFSALPDLKPEDCLVIETDCLLPPWHAPQGVFDVYIEDLVEESGATETENMAPWVDPPEGPFDAKDLAAWEWLHRTVATAVTAFDADIGKLLKILHEKNLYEESTIIFSALAGYPLGEHNMLGYTNPIPHEELAHVPLVVRYPGGNNAGDRIAGLSSHDSLNTEPLQWLELPALEKVVSITDMGRAIRTSEWSLLEPGPQLFERPADTFEVNNLANQNLDIVETLQQNISTNS